MMDDREPLLAPEVATIYTTTHLDSPNEIEAGLPAKSGPGPVTPLPWAQISILWALYLVYPMVYEIIFPFVSES